MNELANYKLLPGYAETSTRRYPKEPTCVVVSQSDCDRAKYVGTAVINGQDGWQAFRIGRQYYFQFHPNY